MKYFLFIVGVLFMVGCKENEEDVYEWVNVPPSDTIYLDGWYIYVNQSWVKKRKDETLEQALKRFDSLYGHSPFIAYPHDSSIKLGSGFDQNTTITADPYLINNETGDTLGEWQTVVGTGTVKPVYPIQESKIKLGGTGMVSTTIDKVDWSKQRNDNTWAKKPDTTETSNMPLTLPASEFKLGGAIEMDTTITSKFVYVDSLRIGNRVPTKWTRSEAAKRGYNFTIDSTIKTKTPAKLK